MAVLAEGKLGRDTLSDNKRVRPSYLYFFFTVCRNGARQITKHKWHHWVEWNCRFYFEWKTSLISTIDASPLILLKTTCPIVSVPLFRAQMCNAALSPNLARKKSESVTIRETYPS